MYPTLVIRWIDAWHAVNCLIIDRRNARSTAAVSRQFLPEAYHWLKGLKNGTRHRLPYLIYTFRCLSYDGGRTLLRPKHNKQLLQTQESNANNKGGNQNKTITEEGSPTIVTGQVARALSYLLLMIRYTIQKIISRGEPYARTIQPQMLMTSAQLTL